MSRIDAPALCVSVHDVAPATWPLCLRLLSAINAVAPIPLTWLVVPCYHGDPSRSADMESQLAVLAALGHELALHGYTHSDDAPPPHRWRARFLRGVYTQHEGEFAAVGAEQAQRLLALGQDWFAARGWPVHGFVAPAWLISDAAWHVITSAGFAYTTTYGCFHALCARSMVRSPSLVYASRNAAGRMISPVYASALAASMQSAPLVRFGLHPRDAEHPGLLLHAQRLLDRLLHQREPMTKVDFARRLSPTA